MNSTYLAGSFYDWRDKVKKSLPSQRFEDPRNHRQNCIAALVEDDMCEAMRCSKILVGLPYGKSLPTMTYAEVGAAKYNDHRIIVVDENEPKEPILAQLADNKFSNFDDAIKYLRRIKHRNENRIDPDEEPNPARYNNDKGQVKRIVLLGDVPGGFSESIMGKAVDLDYNLVDIDRFHLNTDLLIVNFSRGKRAKKDILLMGVAYASKTPIIMTTENPIIYPPLAGLARRIFAGPERFLILGDYLKQITSNDINSEARVMYDLFKKHNS